MSTRALQPSEYEIQREVEALRDIRRRSTTPGALTIDPDLPNKPSPTSQSPRPRSTPSPAFRSDADSSTSSHASTNSDPSTHGGLSGDSSHSEPSISTPADDPFHLFWVPADVHPEIAPAEFRAFLKEHARAVPPSDTQELSRSASSSSITSLGRKHSMLTRQYQPRENDGVEDEQVVPLRRNRSYLYANPVPQLTFDDLQRLEQLAEEASESDDPSKLRNLLRRSLSLNLSPTAIDRMDTVPDMGDEADAPIIVPPPGQILRRAARTKIRKPGLPSDGGSHRFQSTRRGVRAATLPHTTDQRNSSDFSTSDHGELSTDLESMTQQRRQTPTFSDDGVTNQRPDSYSEEVMIFDAYARDDEDESAPSTVPIITSTPPVPPEPANSAPQLSLPQFDTLSPILHEPQPQRLLSPQPSLESTSPQPSRTPSPSTEGPARSSSPESVSSYTPSVQPQQQLDQTPAPPPQQLVPEPSYPPQIYQPQPQPPTPQHPPPKRDKKGLFGKWGGDKSSKKAHKEKDKESRERSEKEKDTGFFGSLFGGKKKHESEFSTGMAGGAAGREAAQALLGASKSSKNYVPPSSPGLVLGANPYARYPIHVERAIYRLSHIKLANPRRPLYEQVLISNLMFWYLGVINKAQTPPTSGSQQVNNSNGTEADNTGAGQGQGAGEGDEGEQEQREREREQEQRERTEKERMERERLERERELELQRKKEPGKRGSLTKTSAGGGPGGRRAEMPIKGPQYEMQHRVMEQEYGNYNQRGPGSPNGQHYSRQQSPPQMNSPQQTQVPEQSYYTQDQQQSRLPPGAMPPVDQTASWSNVQQPQSPSPQRSRKHSAPSRQNISSQDEYIGVGGRIPGRSLSANAVPPTHTNGAKIRKGGSLHAQSQPQPRRPRSTEGQSDHYGNGIGEEEDMPLATLRQQQRRNV